MYSRSDPPGCRGPPKAGVATKSQPMPEGTSYSIGPDTPMVDMRVLLGPWHNLGALWTSEHAGLPFDVRNNLGGSSG
eukprot:6471586-Amphidinium_carterae.1